MASITKQVWEILDNDITIKKDLERGIVNVSALSQYLLDAHAIQGSLDSVISAIRRYKASEGVQDDYKQVAAALRDAVISTKTNVSILTLRNAASTYKYLCAIMADEEFLEDDVFRLIKRRHDVQIVVDRDSMRKAKRLFPQSCVESAEQGVVEVSITFTEQGWQTKGVISRIANELAIQDVNIELAFSLYPTFSLFIGEKYLLRAHEALMRIAGR